MVSFKRYLASSLPQASPQHGQGDAFHRLSSSLIEGIAIHAVEYRPEQKALFQSSVRQMAAKLDANTTAEAPIVGAEVIRALQRYNLEVETFVSARARELHSVVAMLTNTVVQLCGSTAASAQNLVELERDLKSADKIEDIQVLKARLSQHLREMRRETDEQQRRFEQLNTVATQANQGQPLKETPVWDNDPATGLRTARAAEAAIQESILNGVPVAPVIFVIERLKAINDRYGFAIGDEILTIFGKHLVQRFPNNTVYRWRGPSFLVLLGRDGQSEAVRREIQRAVSGNLEHTVSSGSRSVLLPIRWTWAMIPVAPSTQVALVVEEIDRFVAKQFTNSV